MHTEVGGGGGRGRRRRIHFLKEGLGIQKMAALSDYILVGHRLYTHYVQDSGCTGKLRSGQPTAVFALQGSACVPNVLGGL